MGFGQLLKGWELNTIVQRLRSANPGARSMPAQTFSGTGELVDRWNFFGNPGDFKPTISSGCALFLGAPATPACAAKALALDGWRGRRQHGGSQRLWMLSG